MCGIIGFNSKKVTANQLILLHKLMKESKIRGLHSFGIAYYDNYNLKILTLKTFEFPSYNILADAPKKLIWHNRYSTSGDWKNMNNNQPITINNDISVAINGVISMKPTKEYEKEYKINCSTKNDAEIFARKLEQNIDPEIIIKNLKGSCACVYLYKGNIYAIRNNTRPLHWFKYNKAIYVISTVNIIDRVFPNCKVNVIEPYKLFCLEDYV